MRDPFAAGLGPLFRGPGSAAAVYVNADGASLPIRIIRGQPTVEGTLPGRSILVDTNMAQIQRSDVPRPMQNDLLVIGGEINAGIVSGGELFRLLGEPRLDLEGMTWICELDPDDRDASGPY